MANQIEQPLPGFIINNGLGVIDIFRSITVVPGVPRIVSVTGPRSVINIRMTGGQLVLYTIGHIVRLEGEDNEIIFNAPGCSLINTSQTTEVGGNSAGTIQNIGDAEVMRLNTVVDVILPQNDQVEDLFEFNDLQLPVQEIPIEERKVTYCTTLIDEDSDYS